MDVLMPQLGETVTEGKIVKWFKSPGDTVKPGENLFEIETDKTSMEVPAIAGGTLTDIRYQVGETAKVGSVVAVIAGDAAQAASPAAQAVSPPSPAPAKPAAETARVRANDPGSSLHEAARRDTAPYAYPHMDPFREVRTPEHNFGPARLPGGVTVTPLARRLAGERGIDLSGVRGSGPRGRIVAADIEKAAPRGAPAISAGPTAAEVKALYQGVAHEEVPVDSIRRTIATRLVEAKQTIPHFYLTADLDIDRLTAMRKEANAAAPRDAEGRPAFRLSLNDFIIKAWAAALMRVPKANAVFAGDRILRFAHADIGVAVAIEDGLITPVIRNADTKSLTTISAEMRDLGARARAKRLRPDEYQGGSSTISNLGMYGVREFAAIINPPQSTILAVGAARRAAIEAEDGGVRFVGQMTVTLSCDHRVIDGALGARLLAVFKGLIEQPVTALI